jgi:tRNA-modifying protein YgfZ
MFRALRFSLGWTAPTSYLNNMAATTLLDRAVLLVSGPEARAFLQGLLTQDVLTLQPGAPRWAGLLSAQGKALFDMILWADPDDPDVILLDVEAGRLEALAKRLTMYRLRRAVTITAMPNLAVHWSARATDGATPDPRLPALGYRWLAPPRTGDASAAFRAHRLEQGVTEGVSEIGEDKTLWLECNARELNGVDFTKGCYVGQENTARMHYRSKVNRRLVVLPLDHSMPDRQRIIYAELGVAIDHRPVDTLESITLPHWLEAAVKGDEG